jgi:hypothetical protein
VYSPRCTPDLILILFTLANPYAPQKPLLERNPGTHRRDGPTERLSGCLAPLSISDTHPTNLILGCPSLHITHSNLYLCPTFRYPSVKTTSKPPALLCASLSDSQKFTNRIISDLYINRTGQREEQTIENKARHPASYGTAS